MSHTLITIELTHGKIATLELTEEVTIDDIRIIQSEVMRHLNKCEHKDGDYWNMDNTFCNTCHEPL